MTFLSQRLSHENPKAEKFMSLVVHKRVTWAYSIFSGVLRIPPALVKLLFFSTGFTQFTNLGIHMLNVAVESESNVLLVHEIGIELRVTPVLAVD